MLPLDANSLARLWIKKKRSADRTRVPAAVIATALTILFLVDDEFCGGGAGDVGSEGNGGSLDGLLGKSGCGEGDRSYGKKVSMFCGEPYWQ